MSKKNERGYFSRYLAVKNRSHKDTMQHLHEAALRSLQDAQLKAI